MQTEGVQEIEGGEGSKGMKRELDVNANEAPTLQKECDHYILQI